MAKVKTAKPKEEPISKALYQELEDANTQLLEDVEDLKETLNGLRAVHKTLQFKIEELTPKPNINPNVGILFIEGSWVKNGINYKSLQEAQDG